MKSGMSGSVIYSLGPEPWELLAGGQRFVRLEIGIDHLYPMVDEFPKQRYLVQRHEAEVSGSAGDALRRYFNGRIVDLLFADRDPVGSLFPYGYVVLDIEGVVNVHVCFDGILRYLAALEVPEDTRPEVRVLELTAWVPIYARDGRYGERLARDLRNGGCFERPLLRVEIRRVWGMDNYFSEPQAAYSGII